MLNLPAPADFTIHYAGRFLRMVQCGRWEYAERTSASGAAFIGAVTPENCLIVTEEYRIPVATWVIGCPAGLIGDEHEGEAMETAVIRELEEEAGYTAKSVRKLTRGPTSPGMTTEIMDIVLAEGLQRISAGGGGPLEQIKLHEVPLSEIDAWLAAKEQEGRLIDPKVYAVLYFINRGR